MEDDACGLELYARNVSTTVRDRGPCELIISIAAKQAGFVSR